MQSGTRNYIRTIVQVSLLIALAIALRSFSPFLPIAGIPAIRISFSEIFTKTAAILFGPFFGGISSGILDVGGYFLNPAGPYLPLLTATAVLGGVMTALLWTLTGCIDYAEGRNYYLVFFASIGFIGGINRLILSLWPESSWSRFLDQLGKNRSFATTGLMAAAAVGFGLFLVNLLLRRINGKWQINGEFSRVLIATGLTGLLVSTLNTLILQQAYPELAKIPFLVFWVPRIIKEVFMIIIQAYVITYLISIYRKYMAKA